MILNIINWFLQITYFRLVSYTRYIKKSKYIYFRFIGPVYPFTGWGGNQYIPKNPHKFKPFLRVKL